MKRIATFCLFQLFLSQVITFAQPTDFAPVGAKWYYSEQAFVAWPVPKNFPHIVEVESKEMYQGKLCSKLVGVASDTVPEPLYVYSQNDSVFFYSLRSNQFELLYDFTAQAGDSWTMHGLKTTIDLDSLTVQVDSVSQIIVSGNTLKVLHTTCNYLFFDWGCDIIAGVGNTAFLTPDFGLFEGGPWGLRCYTDASIDLHFVSYPCDTTLVVTATADPADRYGIRVFPNPAGPQINITLEGSLHQPIMRLYNQFGLLLRQTPIQLGQTAMPTGDLPSGLYFWDVSAENKRIKCGRTVIIQ